MAITEGLAAAKTGFDLIKGLREAMGRPDVNPSEIQARLVEVQSLILDVQRSLGDAEEENRTLRKQLGEQQRIEEFGKDFTFEEGVHWKENYPYCPNCWNAERKPIRLAGPYMTNSDSHARWKCPVHDTVFNLKKRQIHS